MVEWLLVLVSIGVVGGASWWWMQRWRRWEEAIQKQQQWQQGVEDSFDQRWQQLGRILKQFEGQQKTLERKIDSVVRQQQQWYQQWEQQYKQWQREWQQQEYRFQQQFAIRVAQIVDLIKNLSAQQHHYDQQLDQQREVVEQISLLLEDLLTAVKQQVHDDQHWQQEVVQRLAQLDVRWNKDDSEHRVQLQKFLQRQFHTLQTTLFSVERSTTHLVVFVKEFAKLSKSYQQWNVKIGQHFKTVMQGIRQISRSVDRISTELQAFAATFPLDHQQQIETAEHKEPIRRELSYGQQRLLEAEIQNLVNELHRLNEQLQRATLIDHQYGAVLSEVLQDIEQSARKLLDKLQGQNLAHPPTVFILEDSTTFQEHLEHILQSRYQLCFADTIAAARQQLAEQVPDLCLFDIELPDGNGLQLCRELRQKPQFRDIPILFISSLTDRETKLQGFQAGANDYVSKPFDKTELLVRIDRHLELARSRRSLEESLLSMSQIVEGTIQLQQIFLKLLQQLSEARQAAEQANRAKSTFLASMSHELRTPLNAILGFTQILRQDPSLSPKQREYIETMFRSGNHLLQMINDILDLSKIEAGKIQLLPTDVDLAQFVEDIRGMFQLRCQEKGLWFKVEQDPALPQYVVLDAQKLRQVLINLIGNAIKFTSEGGITLRVKLVVTAAKEKRIRWEVEDTGRGIPPEQVDKIMEAFHQVEAMVSEGTGLGLAISRALVQLMGGELKVKSTVGEGSIFSFDLPLKTPVEELISHQIPDLGAIPQQWLIAQSQAHALIVDDSRTNRQILKEFLAKMNIASTEAENGWQAWKLLQRREVPIDVVLTDIVMPEMNGIELVKRIRSQEQEQSNGQHLPVIGITASVLRFSDEEMLQMGFDAILYKPFRLSDLVQLLKEKTSIQFVITDATPVGQPPAVTVEEIRQWFVQLPQAHQDAIAEAMLTQDLASLKEVLGQYDATHPVVRFLHQQIEEENVVFFAKLSMQLTQDTEE